MSYGFLKKLVILVLAVLIPLLAKGNQTIQSNLNVVTSNTVDIEDVLKTIPTNSDFKVENITNILEPKHYKEEISLKVNLDPNYKAPLEEKPFFESFERRYQIILIVSIPASYMVTKFLMEQVSVYNYKDYTRSLNTQQWAYIIASSIIIPLIVATEDYIKYKEIIEMKF